MTRSQRILQWLDQPVDAAGLAALRILLGAAIAATVLACSWPLIPEYLSQSLHLTHYGFGWLPAPDRIGLYALLALTVLAALGTAAGLFYRASTAVLAAGSAWLLLLDATQYRSDLYLVVLLAVLLCALPAQRIWSLDAHRRAGGGATVPRWTQYSIALLFALILLYAGLARLGGDWLDAYPLRFWLAGRADLPLVGKYFFNDSVAYGWSWAWLGVHLLALPVLFWRRFRADAFWLLVGLYAANAIVLGTGWYALLISLGLLAFFPPDWPRRLLRRGAAPVDSGAVAPTVSRVALVLAAAVLTFHALFPLRGLLYADSAVWTDEGQWFAWRNDLRVKICKSKYSVRDPASGATWSVKLQDHLTPTQVRAGSGKPDLILQIAQHLVSKHGGADAKVTAEVRCTLNGRRYGPLFSSDLDLADLKRGWGHADWLLPLDSTLSPLGGFPMRRRGPAE